MRRLLLLALLALALCAVDPTLIAPPSAEAAKPVVTRPRAKSTQSTKSTKSTKSSRSRRSSVRSTRRPTTRRDSTKSISSHVSQRVRRASISSTRSAPARTSVRSSVSRRLSTHSLDRRESYQRQTSVRRLSTRSAPGGRMGVLPRLKMTLRRWVTPRRGRESQSVDRAHNRHSTDARNRAASNASTKSAGTSGAINWPPNYGFQGTPVQKTLPAGTRIDRYGYEGGRFVSPVGTPYAARALPPGTDKKPYNTYVTNRPVSVKAGTAAPWFNQPGGGTQYHLPDKVRNLVDSGDLRRASQ